MRFDETLRRLFRREKGLTFIETVVALAIFSTVIVTFLNGMISTSKASASVDERATALSLAQSQLEWALNSTYTHDATSYTSAPIPDGSAYTAYSVNITAEKLHDPDDGIQKISVSVAREGKEVITLESYKVDR